MTVPADARLIPRGLARRWDERGGSDVEDRAFQIAAVARVCGIKAVVIGDGDNSLRLGAAIRRRSGARVVLVVHLPPTELARRIERAGSEKVDGVVCVSTCQEAVARNMVEDHCVAYIPHGVDVEYFAPMGSGPRERFVVCCGVHKRNFELLRDVACELQRRGSGVKVVLIAPRAYCRGVAELGPIEVHYDVSDDELRGYYRRATAMIMPLTDSTANNAVLEAMACGTPIICSDVGGVRDYVDDLSGVLCGSEPGEYVDAVEELCRNEARRLRMCDAARLQAEKFAWPSVRQRLRRFVEEAVLRG